MLILHIVAAILGITSSSIRNFLFLTNGSLNPTLQKIIGPSLIALFVTGFGLLLAKPGLLHDEAFWVKMFFVALILVSEFYLVRKRTIWAGFTSLFSWYYAFFWSQLLQFNLGYLGILGLYFMVVLVSFSLARRYGYT